MRSPFRNTGEQIDGSFMLANEIYLVEAKWHKEPTGVGDLFAFHGKLDKAAWTRGLFVSFNGFTGEGLMAFGTAKRMICLTGRDIYDALDREIPLPAVLERKVRGAAERAAHSSPSASFSRNRVLNFPTSQSSTVAGYTLWKSAFAFY